MLFRSHLKQKKSKGYKYFVNYLWLKMVLTRIIVTSGFPVEKRFTERMRHSETEQIPAIKSTAMHAASAHKCMQMI